MRKLTRMTSVALVASLMAACGRQSPALDEAMQADLDAAAAASVELAPRGSGTSVVSPIESKNPTQPRLAPVRQVRAPAPAPKPQTRQVTQTSESPEPAAARPATRPAVSPPPPGGYKTVNEVIRNAPFPIKP